MVWSDFEKHGLSTNPVLISFFFYIIFNIMKFLFFKNSYFD